MLQPCTLLYPASLWRTNKCFGRVVLFWTAVVRNKVGGGQIIAGARHLSVSYPASK